MWFVALVLLLGPAFQHTPPAHPKKSSDLPRTTVLVASSAKRLGIPFFNFYGQAKQDAGGNVYFHAATRRYSDSSIIRIPYGDSEPKAYSLPEKPARETAFIAFDVAPSGRVYVLSENADHRSIVFEFGGDGDISSRTELGIPPSARGASMSVFEATGNFFVLGYYDSSAPDDLRGKTFMALTSPDGKVFRDLKNSRGIDLNTLGEEPLTACSYRGEDGNLYVLASDEILVLTASGDFMRRIKLRKPDDAALTTKLIVSQGLAAVWLQSDSAVGKAVELTLETVDIGTGRVVGVYSASDELGDNAVTFSRSEGFVFLRNDGGKVSLLTAHIR